MTAATFREHYAGLGYNCSTMLTRLTVMFVIFSSAAFGQNWNPKLAADYLDSRQEKWFAGPTAGSADGPCVSCHTGLTYLLAPLALRRALSETQPTKYETALIDRLRSKVGNKPAAALRDVEVIFAALFLANQDRGKATLGAEAQLAFEQLWSLQSTEGKSKGGWRWYSADLDPWETPDSTYFGSALAALAIGTAPVEYQNRSDIRDRINILRDYFEMAYEGQPLHNRLALLWASSRLPVILSTSKREALIKEIFEAQESDGGWALKSLGPWRPHKEAPVDAGSNNFATGFVVYALRQVRVPSSDPRMRRALLWLGSRQDSASGSWRAVSMNKVRLPESMEASFMQDAATAFATLALLAESQAQTAGQAAPDQPAVTVHGKTYTPRSILARNMGTNEDQTTAFPPHKIIGNIYYVGTRTLSSFLIVIPQGKIMIDSKYVRTVHKIAMCLDIMVITF